MSNILGKIPSVSELLASPPLKSLVETVSHNTLVSQARSFLDKLGTELQSKAAGFALPSVSELANRMAQWLGPAAPLRLHPTINATGQLFPVGNHGTPLPQTAIDAWVAASSGFCLAGGGSVASGAPHSDSEAKKLHSTACCRRLIHLTGAEAALVTSSFAAAKYLALAALATNQEVVVARAELIETDADHRLPELIAASGARLHEVGMSNITRLSDYEAAIGPTTSALWQVNLAAEKHSSTNSSVAISELASLTNARKIPLVCDLANGSLFELSQFGIPSELRVQANLQAGADIVLLPGNGLVSGPTCGILLGKTAVIQRLASHPLANILSPDLPTLAALLATLQLYQDQETAELEIPILSLLSTPVDNLRNRAERMAPQILATKAIASVELSPHAVASTATADPSATVTLSISPSHGTASELAVLLASQCPALLGKVVGNQLQLNLRSVLPKQDLLLVAAFEKLPAPSVAS